ncbi:MAG: PIN domain-containing protein [Verrucomicrobia bacterium]|nr:PIN domain-containing protein [Verrucomicrobiota bacterium]
MAEIVLLDTGPLVGLMDAREASHAWAVSAFQRVRPPLWTCQAVLTETCFLLRNQPSALARLRHKVQDGHFVDGFDFRTMTPRAMALMERYANVPMSFADACLVTLAENQPEARLFTLDRDFLVYCRHGNQPLTLLAPFLE